MNIELNKEEYDKLINVISQKIRKELTGNTITNEVYLEAERLAKRIIELHKPEIEVKCKSVDLITPVIEAILLKNGFLENIITSQIRKYFNSNEFAKVSIRMLQDRISQIEHDLENDVK